MSLCECGICGLEVTKEGNRFIRGHNGRGKTLSKEIRQKMKENHADFKGKNHPKFGKPCSDETKSKIGNGNKGKIRSEKTKQKMCENNRGENNPNFKGWISRLPYCELFDNELKEKIRNRDNRTCQLCYKNEIDNKQKLSVHHIHYDKENCYPDLITVCHSCNCKVNYNRDYYEEFFMNILEKRGLLNDN